MLSVSEFAGVSLPSASKKSSQTDAWVVILGSLVMGGPILIFNATKSSAQPWSDITFT